MYVCMYIYCHPETDCFVVSKLFRVARHAGRFKRGSSVWNVITFERI